MTPDGSEEPKTKSPLLLEISRLRSELEDKSKAASLFLSLVESMPQNVFSKDRQGRFTFANKRYCLTEGVTLEELKGKTDFEIHPPAAARKYREDDRMVMETEQVFQANEEHHLLSGEVFHSRVIKAPIYDETGQVTGVVGFFWDVTEEIGAARELRQAKELAEAASRAKSDFLATMSHEIRTPLHIILGVSEVLRDSPLGPEQREQAEMLIAAGKSLHGLIDDVLDFSRIEAGDVSLETIPFGPRALFEEAVRPLAAQAHGKGLECVLNVAANLPGRLLGDPTRIRQVFINLAANAVKFTETGEVETRVQATSDGPGACLLKVSVRDTGIGVAPEKLESIFDRFSQADASTTRKYGGSGLGLSICRKLVELMGGSLTARSLPGQGSTFAFTLPLAVADPTPDHDPAALAGLRALVVEPGAAVGDMFTDALEALGAEADHLEEPETALAVLREAATTGAPYDVVLVGARQRSGDGFALVERLPRMGASRLRVFLLVGAGALGGHACRADALGLEGVLTKPPMLEELRRRLAPAQAQKTDSPPLPEAAGETAPQPCASRRILIVEDSPSVRALMVLFLQNSPHRFDLAEDGLRALERFTAEPYDVILLDMLMPVMDGYEAVRRMRAIERASGRKPARIIALTAFAETDVAGKCLARGCDAFLPKPVTREALLRAIEQPDPA